MTLGHLNPSGVKANSPLQVRHLSCFITEKDKTLLLPKFTSLIFSEIIPLFSSPLHTKCNFFQNCSPSALETMMAFTPCSRSFGVSPQPSGRTSGGREFCHAGSMTAGQSAEVSSVPRGPSRSPATFSGSLYASSSSSCQQHDKALISRLAQLIRLWLCHSKKWTGNSLSDLPACSPALGSAPAHLSHWV